MIKKIQKIAPNLWFEDQAEEAAKTYASIFPNSKIEESRDTANIAMTKPDFRRERS